MLPFVIARLPIGEPQEEVMKTIKKNNISFVISTNPVDVMCFMNNPSFTTDEVTCRVSSGQRSHVNSLQMEHEVVPEIEVIGDFQQPLLNKRLPPVGKQRSRGVRIQRLSKPLLDPEERFVDLTNDSDKEENDVGDSGGIMDPDVEHASQEPSEVDESGGFEDLVDVNNVGDVHQSMPDTNTLGVEENIENSHSIGIEMDFNTTTPEHGVKEEETFFYPPIGNDEHQDIFANVKCEAFDQPLLNPEERDVDLTMEDEEMNEFVGESEDVKPFDEEEILKVIVPAPSSSINDEIPEGTFKTVKLEPLDKPLLNPNERSVDLTNEQGWKKYRCYVCEKNFSSRSSLMAHSRVHTGEKPFECELCEKKFSQNSHLRAHLRSHKGQQPFRCDVCDKKCQNRTRLTAHMRKHTGEKS